MSVATLDAIEQTALDNSNIGPFKYTQELLANRPYHIFGVVKFVGDILVQGLGVANASVKVIHIGLTNLMNTENIVFFVRDIIELPEHSKKLYNKVSGWWNGSTTFLSTANQARKFVGHIASTVGDYVDGISALKGLKVNVAVFDVISERIGSIGSAIGAGFRIVDYAVGDVSSNPPHSITPTLEKVRNPIVESKNFWDLSRDVSILALSVLCIGCGGAAAVPAALVVGLSSSILGSRMIAYYHEAKLKAVDTSHAQIKISEKVLKTA
jgi:hypothetical protein